MTGQLLINPDFDLVVMRIRQVLTFDQFCDELTQIQPQFKPWLDNPSVVQDLGYDDGNYRGIDHLTKIVYGYEHGKYFAFKNNKFIARGNSKAAWDVE